MAQNLAVLRTPNRTAFTLPSRTASISQLLYELQFWNYQFNAYQSNAGFYEFGVTSGDFAEILVGMTLTWRTEDGSLAIRGTVTSLNGALVTIDQPYTGANIFKDGYIVREDQTPTYSALPNYRIEIRIENFSTAVYTFTLDGYGYLFIDLGGIVENILVDNMETYAYLNVSYEEVWDGGSNIRQFFDRTLATLAERQILSFLGSNLWEMMLKLNTPPDYPVGKLLTKFETKELSRWIGWKRTASCLVDPDITTRIPNNPQWVFNNIDINGDYQGFISTSQITDTTPRIDSHILPAGTNYYTEVYLRDFVSQEDLSERMLYKNADECYNPIMIEWLNEDGASEQWLFTLDQVILDTVENGLVYERPITQDLEIVSRTKYRKVDKWVQRMTLFANNLTQDQVDALHDMKRSDFMQVWLNKEGTEYVGVIVVEDYSDSFKTKNTLHEFSITIEFPDNFDFFNAKKY